MGSFWRHRVGEVAEFIQQERSKHANPAKTCFREGARSAFSWFESYQAASASL